MHLLRLRVDLQLRLAHLTLQNHRQLFLELPVPLRRSCQFLIGQMLHLLSELLIVVLLSPCLGLCPHSTGYLRDEMGHPWNPQLIRDGLKDLGGVLDDLLDRLIGCTFGEPVVNILQMCQ